MLPKLNISIHKLGAGLCRCSILKRLNAQFGFHPHDGSPAFRALDQSGLKHMQFNGNRILPSVPGLLIFLLLVGCNTRPPVEESSTSWADSSLASMTLEEKAGQMIMVALPAPADITSRSAREDVQTLLQDNQPGGVVLFAGNPLTHSVWVEWAQQQSGIPLLVGLDAEWGAGYRLEDFTRFPDAMAIAATGSEENAFYSGIETAREAASVGINVLFAPTVDVNTNPSNPVIGTRSFSDSPDSVSLYAGAFARGVRSQGLIPVAKHFPGHGSTSRDSHVDLPVAERDDDAFMSIDMHPFTSLISDSLEAIMTAHIVARGHSFEDSVASTFSRRLLTHLLRDSLGFEGLIFSDALNMAGATSLGSGEEIAVRAVEAGVDVLLMPESAQAARFAIINAVRTGRLSASRIDSSVARILRAKEARQLDQRYRHTNVAEILSVVGSDDAQNRAVWMAREAVTVLKDDALLPLSGERASTLLISVDFRSYSSSGGDPANSFRLKMEERNGGRLTHIAVNPRSWISSMPSIQSALSTHHKVVFADYTGIVPVFGWDRRRMLTDITSLTDRLVYISFGSPYALTDVPDSAASILQSYDASPAMAEASADVLYGMSSSSGRLPVFVSERFPRGSGMLLQQQVSSAGSPASADMDVRSLKEIDSLIRAAIADSAFPTASFAVGRDNVIARQGAFGYHTFERNRGLQEDDLFDLASLTKVIATTTAIMQLYEAGIIDLDRPVADYLPAFGQNGKGSVTIRDLLTHTGGLIPFRPFHMQGVRTSAEVKRRILADTLAYEPGTQSRYSDFGPITLAWMIEELSGMPFDDYVRENIFDPLSMYDTGYLKVRRGRVENAVPTEIDDYFRNRALQGEVHDETAYLLGGTAGHAGLFSNAEDLARFAGMLIAQGRVGDRIFLRPETLRRFTTRVANHHNHTRALGWDTKSMNGYSSAGQYFGPRSFGHTGFTGTSFWVDPDSRLFVILLTNRVYPTRNNRKHIPVRPAIANQTFEAFRESMLRQAE